MDAIDRPVGEPVWPLRLSQDHGGVAASGLECGTGSGAADLHPTDEDLSVGTPVWRREGLKVPAKQKPRGRLWLNDGSCLRLRPEHANHVWSYDFVSAFTHDGRTLRRRTLIDEYTRRCLALRVARRLNSYDLIETLADVMLEHGVPEHIRSDNGPEFVALKLRQWLSAVGAKTRYLEPGSPWENGYCESFNGTLRDECLNGEIFYSLKEAQVVIEQWRVQYNTVRPHSSLGYRPPAPQAILPKQPGAWGCGKRSAFPTSPHPRRRLRTNVKRGVTLTLHLVQKIRQVTGHECNGDISTVIVTLQSSQRLGRLKIGLEYAQAGRLRIGLRGPILPA